MKSADAAVDLFEASMDGWRPEQTARDDSLCDNPEVRQWETRMRRTRNILAILKRQLKDDCDKDRLCAYYLNDTPVGLMLMTNRSTADVDILVTHPGSLGAGGALLEQAVKTSIKWGHKGKLKLYTSNSDNRRAFESFGFELDASSGDMILDLGTKKNPNSHWDYVNGRWLIKRYAQEKYLAQLGMLNE